MGGSIIIMSLNAGRVSEENLSPLEACIETPTHKCGYPVVHSEPASKDLSHNPNRLLILGVWGE